MSDLFWFINLCMLVVAGCVLLGAVLGTKIAQFIFDR